MNRAKLIGTLVVVPPLAVGLAWVGATVMNAMDRPPPPVPVEWHDPRLVVEPAEILLGQRSQCDGLLRTKARLRNASREPAVVEDWIGTCGCTVAAIPRPKGFTLAPGEEVEFEVASDSWVAPGPKLYRVDFVEKLARKQVGTEIRYEVVGDLFTDPAYGYRYDEPSASFKVASRGGTPFRVTGVAIGGNSAPFRVAEGGPAPEHQVVVDWSAVDALAGPDWSEQDVVISTDVPGCPSLHLRLWNPAEQRKGGGSSGGATSPPAPGAGPGSGPGSPPAPPAG